MKNTWINTIEKEWNDKIPSVPNNDKVTLIHTDRGMLMAKLLWEEWTELKAAKGDLEYPLIEIADALGDLSYLLYGMAAQYGLNEAWKDLEIGVYYDIPDTINNLIASIQSSDLCGIITEMKTLEKLIEVELMQFGLHDSFDKIMSAIHFSNLTKLSDGKLLIREDGKILKNKETFKHPDLSFIDDLNLSVS